MPCPFSALASGTQASLAFLKASPQAHAAAVAAHKAAATAGAANVEAAQVVSLSHQLLSDHLKIATADAHRRVETSEGVRRLLGSGSSVDDEAAEFGRLDYIRWMVMLGCIYAALESALDSPQASQASMLQPLMRAHLPAVHASTSSPSFAKHIYRFSSIVDDIEAHLEELSARSGNTEGEGLSRQELLDSLEMTVDHTDLFSRLHRGVDSLQQSCDSDRSLTADHLRLLSYSQMESTLVYVERIDAVARAQPDLLLSHAYVRYLGDLSGGQHIRRRIQKLFPVEGSKGGFAFYSFPAPAGVADSKWHTDLKNTFRQAMNDGITNTLAVYGASFNGDLQKLKLQQSLLEVQGVEASLAFELNTDLFEGLIGASPQTFIPALDNNNNKTARYEKPVRPALHWTETADSVADSSVTSSTVSPPESIADPMESRGVHRGPFETLAAVLQSTTSATTKRHHLGIKSAASPLSLLDRPVLPLLLATLVAAGAVVASISFLGSSGTAGHIDV